MKPRFYSRERVTSPTVGVQSIVTGVSVCLSVRSHISKTTWPNVTYMLAVISGRGSAESALL